MAKREKPVTLRDIADSLGLSVNTISCALKDRNSIAPETIRRIKRKAEELGYIPNSIASSMRTGITKTIAIILGDIVNAYFAIMIKELERIIREKDYTTIILVTEENAELENKAIQTAISKNVDGIILFPTCRTETGINLIRKSDTPFILIGRHLRDSKMDFIVSDDINGGYIATKFLLDHGHKKILLFAGPDFVSSAFERKQGYIKAMEEAGVNDTDKLIISCNIMVNEDLNQIVSDVLQTRRDFDAIFTYSDIIAFRIIRIARQLHVKLPSIVGYDNIQSKIDYGFDIPSVNIHKTLMAEQAVARLFNRIHHRKTADEYYNKIVPVDLSLNHGC
ncbi:MAG: LacI family transcriptional regulator [Treponema sp.]|jgi:LacI family transcriptional regulator|nr:LacI family transcriptional regulator [Treponema sp.]